MTEKKEHLSHPGYVVFRLLEDGKWQLVGEVNILPGMTAKKGRARAILDATNGRAKPGDTYAAVLRSEWKISLEW